ncbi:hypothetical protein ACS0TY_001412 [Phlomoides rotata]
MGTNMYPSSALLGHNKDESIAALPIDELIEKADGFAEHKYEIVKRLQARKHICGMTGDGVNDAPALKKADIGIAVVDATDAARSASDIVLTEPGLSVIISDVLTSRAIFQRMKNYTIDASGVKTETITHDQAVTVNLNGFSPLKSSWFDLSQWTRSTYPSIHIHNKFRLGYMRWVQTVFQAAETNGLDAITENDLIQHLQADHNKKKDDINAFEVDMSDGMAVEMFGVSPSIEEDQHPEYNLFGTIVHSRFSPDSGHYYAYIKYCCNDSYVSVSTLEEVLSEKAYILFFSRTKQRPQTKFDVVANRSKSHESNGNKTSIMQQTGYRDTKQVSNHLQEFNKSTNGTRSLFHKSSCPEKQVNMKITANHSETNGSTNFFAPNLKGSRGKVKINYVSKAAA